MDNLTVNFSHLDRNTILQDWRWLIGNSRLPILISAAGDAFLQSTENGAITFLDVGSGELAHVADSFEDFKEKLGEIEFVTDHFVPAMVGDLIATGVILNAGQIYSLKKPVALGGEYCLENIEPCDIEVHLSVTGQLCQKLKDLPPGTKISDVSIS